MTRLARVLTAICLISALGACGTESDAGRSFGSSEFVDDIAGRLTAAESTTYTAVFSLANNTTVTIAHQADPAKTSYRFRSGMIIFAGDVDTSCVTGKPRWACTQSPGGAANSATLDTVIDQAGLVRPDRVVQILTQTSLNADALISEETRTIAGTTATCVTVSGVPEPDGFSACVTSEGLLGAFAGAVDGADINLDLDHYTMSVEAGAFAVPAGAKITSASP